MEPTADLQSLPIPKKPFSTGLDVSDAPDSKTPLTLESTVSTDRNTEETTKRENGSTKKLSPLTSARSSNDPNFDSTDVDPPQSPGPSSKHNYSSEIYISPPPSISVCSRPPLMVDDVIAATSPPIVGVKPDDRSTAVGCQFADTKAVLADRRSNFFSQVTRAPVLLPTSGSHSSVFSFQPTANVAADPTCVGVGGITANGHSELSINLVQPSSSERAATAPREDSPSKTVESSRDKVIQPSVREQVMIVYQSAPPPDSAEDVPLVGHVFSPVVLEVDEEALSPRFCARMEPSPERFWGPSVTPIRASGGNSLLRGSERAGHVAELRLVGSAGQLETMGGSGGDGGCRNRGNVHRLGLSSTPSPQESPPTKAASKDPSSSTSTDSLPSTPSSANLPSSQAKSGKLRTFFGDNTPKMFESKSDPPTAEPSTEPAAEGMLTETKKTDLTKFPLMFDIGGKSSSTSTTTSSSSDRSFKNKKGGWSLGGSKSHGTRSPGARPKKSTERTDTGESPKHKQTWRGKMARTILRYGSGPILDVSANSLGVIGVPLEFCASSPFNEFVPLLVSVCTRVVEEKGLTNQGIYRVPGNTGAINLLIEEMTKDPVGLCLDSERWQDVNLVSSLLKLFFRKLPDSLITDELYDAVIEANRLDNSTRRMLKLKKLLHELPEHNFETFHFLAQHLSRVASQEEVNKMDARNLAIVFGPTLVRPQDNNMVNMVRDMTDQCRIIENIILHCSWFFGSWDEDVNVPIDDDSEELAPISGMNDELLAKAESLGKRSSVTF